MRRGDESEDDMLILLAHSTRDLLFSGACLRGCEDVDVPTCRLVLRGSRVSVRAVDRSHTELFVAGLAPWELILHLSIPHSRAPDFTPNLPAADPFFSVVSRTPLSLTPSALLARSLFSDIRTYLYASCPFARSETATVTPTHIRL